MHVRYHSIDELSSDVAMHILTVHVKNPGWKHLRCAVGPVKHMKR